MTLFGKKLEQCLLLIGPELASVVRYPVLPLVALELLRSCRESCLALCEFVSAAVHCE